MTPRYATYLNGIDREYQARNFAGPDGTVWVALTSASPDLPVSTGAVQKALATGTCRGVEEGADFPRRCSDVYIAQFSPAGAILRSTYLGGSRDDGVAGIQIDAAGNVWVAGTTTSTDFPHAKVIGTPTATAFNGSFVVELSADLKSTLQSTVIVGGLAAAFAMDASGGAYIAGYTSSLTLPAVNALQPARTPGLSFSEGFVAKLGAGGTLAYATHFGGGATQIAGLAVDGTGAAVIAGDTEAANLPPGGARYGARSGPSDALQRRPRLMANRFCG